MISWNGYQAQVEANNTDSGPTVTDTPYNVTMKEQVTPTPITEITTYEVTAADETQRTRGTFIQSDYSQEHFFLTYNVINLLQCHVKVVSKIYTNIRTLTKIGATLTIWKVL